MAAGCITDQAREALLEVADSLDAEATANEDLMEDPLAHTTAIGTQAVLERF